MSNRVNLAMLEKMSKEQVNALPLEQIALLLEDLADLRSTAKVLDEAIQNTLAHRFAEPAAQLRRASNKDTGSVRITEGNVIVIAELPKKVTWDQVKLEQAVEQIESWGQAPGEYVSLEYKVLEGKYTAWPTAIRKVFDPARTVGVGRATFKLERKEAA